MGETSTMQGKALLVTGVAGLLLALCALRHFGGPGQQPPPPTSGNDSAEKSTTGRWRHDPDAGKNEPTGRLQLCLPLPAHLAPYKKTSVFTLGSCPKGLLTRHNTKIGTWGVVRVTAGSVRYRVLSGPDSGCAIVIPAGKWFWVGPQVYHQVVFLSDASAFYVEFFGATNETVDPPKFIPKDALKEVH